MCLLDDKFQPRVKQSVDETMAPVQEFLESLPKCLHNMLECESSLAPEASIPHLVCGKQAYNDC